MIDERRKNPSDRGDLLSMLLMAQDEEAGGAGMTDQQVRDEAMTIFLAGHETTANALAWTWYLLSGAPDVEARLHEEVDRVLGGRLPTLADMPNLPYVEQVVTESMRLYPPAWIIGRRAIEEYPVREYLSAGAQRRRDEPVPHCSATSGFSPNPNGSAPNAGRPSSRRRCRHLRTSRLAAARGDVSVNRSPGWSWCS